jgi:hypothetical protein
MGSHWIDYPVFKASSLSTQSDIELNNMLNLKRGRTYSFDSDIEIKKILNRLGTVFITNYKALGLPVDCGAMLGMQLFDICTYDTRNWWYYIPKPQRIGHYPHSHYYWS